MNPQERSPLPHPGKSVDKVQKQGWKMLDAPGVPYLARKEELTIDPLYQRTIISEARVLQIAAAWSWVACGSLLVAERKGEAARSLWVVDGQHRREAAMRRSDIQELPCLVYASDGAEFEARAFYTANCIRGNVTSYDKLRALLAARDQLAIDVVRLMESQGYVPTARDGHPRGVRCVGRFMAMMRGDRATLTKVWPLTAALHDGLLIQEKVFNALIYIAKFGSQDVTDAFWTQRLTATGLSVISNAIDRACALYARGGPRVAAVGVVETLNKGLHQRRRMRLETVEEDK